MRYSGCKPIRRLGVQRKQERPSQRSERTVLGCDYNGWADVPEDEREAIAAFECAPEVPADSAPPFIISSASVPAPGMPQQKAA
jgi:hypothetical protein